jgi:hypothetical protein
LRHAKCVQGTVVCAVDVRKLTQGPILVPGRAPKRSGSRKRGVENMWNEPAPSDVSFVLEVLPEYQ